ncbi:MAG TPA: hypothetical protein VMA74_02960 [Dyella sp.]|uniref:hypothetical protein n=1 Tax=Dyella sp. TaxID=1869338 RepID=UPI002BB891F8|nr:hypothetical protein [Dyella sp.]HUB88666.1 hypothetical protein [Dyella sp.]
MIKLMISAVLLATATVALATPQNAPSAGQTQADTASASAHHVNRSPLKPGDRQCIRDTGSLIPAKKGECLPVPGRSYSKQDIDATGETTLGPALQRLDPAITTYGRGH